MNPAPCRSHTIKSHKLLNWRHVPVFNHLSIFDLLPRLSACPTCISYRLTLARAATAFEAASKRFAVAARERGHVTRSLRAPMYRPASRWDEIIFAEEVSC